jgi:hypothetical protein
MTIVDPDQETLRQTHFPALGKQKSDPQNSGNTLPGISRTSDLLAYVGASGSIFGES